MDNSCKDIGFPSKIETERDSRPSDIVDPKMSQPRVRLMDYRLLEPYRRNL